VRPRGKHPTTQSGAVPMEGASDRASRTWRRGGPTCPCPRIRSGHRGILDPRRIDRCRPRAYPFRFGGSGASVAVLPSGPRTRGASCARLGWVRLPQASHSAVRFVRRISLSLCASDSGWVSATDSGRGRPDAIFRLPWPRRLRECIATPSRDSLSSSPS